MDAELKNKIYHLLNKKRVMTVGVSMNNIPWTSPVYFIFFEKHFYFFSNKNAKHIRYAGNNNLVSCAIFHDSDDLDQIFGLQMSGRLKKVPQTLLHIKLVKKYVKKFNFLQKAFGPQIIDNTHFFLEKFNSELYGFYPDKIYLSDNSKKKDKQRQIDFDQVI